MRYLRCARTGLAAAVLAVALWILWAIALPILMSAMSAGAAGVGSVTVTIDSTELLIAAAVGFVAGFAWRWRR